MKKIWDKYSYAIITNFFKLYFAFILSIRFNSNVDEKLYKVTVSEGDSLWQHFKSILGPAFVFQ